MRLIRPCLFSGFLYPDALFRIKTEEKILCLTFDDGPDPGSTPEILSFLDKHSIKAIFFCTGQAAEKFPGLVSEIRNRGHLIGNHGYGHPDGWKSSCNDYLNDINKAADLTSGTIFRPPYGHLRINQYRYLKKSYKILFWDIMPYDFDSKFTPSESLELLKKKIRPGSIIVLHDSPDSNCRHFLKEFIESMVSKGYIFEIAV